MGFDSMPLLRVLWAALLAVTLAALPLTFKAHAAERVDLELVLAVDVSGSIDSYEFQLQRKGYSDAFRHPRVLEAIRANPLQRIAVSMIEWSGAQNQDVIVGWTLIKDEASANAFADEVLKPPRSSGRWTSISGGIDYAMGMFERSPFQGLRRVIDVSGDGVNNSGRPAETARDEAVKAGVTINGLAILNDRPNPFSNYYQAPTVPLDEYFADKVIGGLGAFMISTNDFEGFERAVVQKLVREIAGLDAKPARGFAGGN
jgi:hypothetical protein